MNFHAHRCITDASVKRSDPTGTLPVRDLFRRDLDKRWTALKRLVVEALGKSDILQLAGPTPLSIQHSAQRSMHAPIPSADKVKGFQAWIDEALRVVVLGKDGAWTAPYIVKAAAMGKARAETLTNRTSIVRETRVRDLASMTVVELQGIMEAVSQQAVRVLAHDLLAGARPSKIARDVALRVEKIGRTRGKQLAAYMVVKTFNSATLDAFRSLGIKKVGTVAERVRIKQTTHGKTIADAARKTHQKRHKGTGKFIPHTPMPSLAEYNRIIEREARLQRMELVEVLTAGDDFVCQVCEDISDDGPYEIDEGESLIPAHPDCRCAFVPAQDERFAGDGAFDGYNPDQPRVPAGQPGGGEFGSTGGGERGSRRDMIGAMLRRGTTSAEILRATGWPSVSVPAQAHAAGLHLERYREGGVMKYRGTPYTPEQRAARESELRGRSAARALERATTPQAAATPTPQVSTPRPTGTNLSSQPSRPIAAPSTPSPTAETSRQSQEVLQRYRENTAGRTGMTPLESGHEVVRAAVQLGHNSAAASTAMSENTRSRMIVQHGSIEAAHAAERMTPSARAEQPRPAAEGGKKPVEAADFQKAGISVLAASHMARQWNEKIPNMTPDEFKKSFLGGVKVRSMSMDWEGRETLRIQGAIAGEHGGSIGTFTRTIDFGTKEAASAYFSINDDSRAHGVGKELLKSNVDTYKKLGMTEVEVHANIDVGGYAWARYGYVPTPSSWSELRRTIGRRLDQIDDPSKDQMKHLLTSNDPKMLWVVADHKLGKQLLLNTNWVGTIKFSDRNTMRRFDAYVKPKPATR